MNSPFSKLTTSDINLNRVQDNVGNAFNTVFNTFGMPIGSILLFGGPSTVSIPSRTGLVTQPNDQGNWLICNGRPLQLSEFQSLFAAIGFAYGGSHFLTTFNLPLSSTFGVTGSLLIKCR